jgi:hypothetical protein
MYQNLVIWLLLCEHCLCAVLQYNMTKRTNLFSSLDRIESVRLVLEDSADLLQRQVARHETVVVTMGATRIR